MTPRMGTCAAMTDAVETVAAAEEEDPSSPSPEEDPSSPPPLKEWAPLNHLMLQVPAKYQNLLVTGDLQLTSVSAVDEHILLGTNTGSVYWYDTVGCTMQRYRAEGQQSAVCRVSAVTSVDHLLAAGHRSGDISVFLVPRLARGDVPDYVRITESNIKKSLQFRVDAGHRAPISALAWSRNAARLFSGDREGTVAVSEIDYVTETVCCCVVVREPTPVVQLQYSRQTLLVASRGRCALLTWPDPAGAEPQPRQVGTKPRKSPADLGACFLESDGGEMTVLAARPSLKVVTADLTGQVSATVSLKPTLETAGSVPLLFPVAAPTSEPSPGRLAPLWPGAVALYDNRTLLVVDVVRWEIVWRCDHLPAILDLTVSGEAVFVLCSARRLIRLSQTPDNHPAVCDNMRVANGDLSFDEVMQELKSSVPVNQVKTLLSSVHGQLGRSGLLDAFTSQKEAVSSLTSRVSSLVAGRLGAAVSRERLGSAPAGRAPLRAATSSPDVRDPADRAEEVSSPLTDTASVVSAGADGAAASAAAAAVDDGPIARQLRPRRRPGRRRVGRPSSGDARSLETVSLGGERVVTPDSETPTAMTTSEVLETEAGSRRGSGAEERVASDVGTGGEERVRTGDGQSVGDKVPSEASERTTAAPPRPDSISGSSGGPVTPVGPLDFTQFYPHEVRPRLQRTDSELEEERKDKERRLAALLGLEELAAPHPPPPPPPPPAVASGGSSGTPSPPTAEELRGDLSTPDGQTRPSSWMGGGPLYGVASQIPETQQKPEPETEPEPEPSYLSLFPLNKKRSSPPPPPRPPITDSETGEPLRHVVEVQHPKDTPQRPRAPAGTPSAPGSTPRVPSSTPPVPISTSTPRPARPTDLEVATEATEDSEPTAADWRPWERHSAPCYVMTLSACARYAVLTDAECRVFWAPAAAPVPVWERLDYSACQVAVSWDGRRVWRLDANGAAYSLADPEPGRPTGTQWVRAASDVLQLAADATAVWYIKRGGRLYVQRDLSAHRCASSELSVDTPGPVIHVTARDGVVWAVTDKGNVLWRVGVSRAQLDGYSWEPLTLESLKARAVFLTAGELGWLVDDRGRLHVTSGVSASLPRGMDSVWRRVLAERSSSWISGQQVAVMSPGAALRPSLAVEGAVAWLADPGVMSVMTCRHHIIAVRWEQFVPRGPRQEWSEIHADGLYQRRGQLWALSGRGQLYGGHGHDGDLQLVPLPERHCSVACVSAAPGALWLLTAAGAVYVREGMEQTATGNDWVQLDLVQMDGCRLVHLSVGAQSVWACDAAGRVLVRLGPTVARRSAASLQPAWVSIDRPAGVRFVMVCVGPADQQVWALDSAGVPWRRCGLDDQPVVGTQWRPAGGVSADRLAVSPAGVWARCRRSGRVHRWMETAAQWCRVPGITRHASVSVSGELWVVHRGALYTLHDLTLRPGRPIEPRVTARSPPPASATAAEEGDDRDWELVTY